MHIFLCKRFQVSSAGITLYCGTFLNMLIGIFADSNAFQIFKRLHFQILRLAVCVLGKSNYGFHFSCQLRVSVQHFVKLKRSEIVVPAKFGNETGFLVFSQNLSSQAYAHVFSANFAADCFKNPCRATARLRIFALSATKLCSKIRTHFL